MTSLRSYVRMGALSHDFNLQGGSKKLRDLCTLHLVVAWLTHQVKLRRDDFTAISTLQDAALLYNYGENCMRST